MKNRKLESYPLKYEKPDVDILEHHRKAERKPRKSGKRPRVFRIRFFEPKEPQAPHSVLDNIDEV